MAKTRLLQAVCTVALLAAVPAFAQQTTGPGQGATGDSTATTPPGAPAASPGGMAQGSTTDQGSGSMAPAPHSSHSSTMSHPRRAMRGGMGDRQNAAVDQLNDQSLRAAQQGRTFSAASDTGAPAASPSGSMSDTPGGSGYGAGGTGGSMSGGTGGGATTR